ncbi:DUF6600 domain-containing protein [Larkinella rosea]|uniref:Uncharacterized protein n=1 Tax=Larkinella rosea TaxID=2025312 RepID=A0A3P1C2A6_9BACT|nr:DUF6600 domain-containing protein [Larkinella rosea]RRB07379.1 hypothetical protein EHT25_06260 [Larkinella rosea]
MKTRRIIPAFGLIIFFVLTLVVPQKSMAQPGVDVPIESFYDDLAPYGQWVPNQNYGQVWMPDVPGDFQPYATNGHWAVTEYGNTWVSDYDWGWAPFHYGRWQFDDYYGRWIWIPDSEWGPAWVSWRSGGGYYGWAPLGPGMSINVNINLPFNYWTFVPQIYFTSPRVYSYCVPRTRVVNVYHNTTIINNVYRYNNRSYGYGPRREEIERYTRQRVPVYRANDVARRGTYGARGGYDPNRSDNRGNYNGNGGYNRNNRGDIAGNYPNSNRSNRTDNSGFSPNRDNSSNRPDFNNRPNRDNSNRPDFNNRSNSDNMSRPDFNNRPNGDISNRPDFNNRSNSDHSNRPDFNNRSNSDNSSGSFDRPDFNNRNRTSPNGFETPSENRSNPGYNPGMNDRRAESRSYQQPDRSSRMERSWNGGGNEGGFQRSERSREQVQPRSAEQAPRHYQERQNSSNREGGFGHRRGPQ